MTKPARNEAIYSQQYRLIKIKTTLGEKSDKGLMLEEFAGTEALSTPFEFRVVLLSDDPDIDLKALLRTRATVTINLPEEKERHVNAMFSSLRQVSQAYDQLVTYVGTLVPWCWFLSLDSDCRIFQNKTVKEIVEQIFSDHEMQDFEFRLQGSYPPREYCVQYRESSFNFISRLLEEEGIFYYFEHDETKHKMIFKDKSQSQDPCPELPVVSYAYSQQGWKDDRDGVIGLERIEQVHTGKIALTDYFFEKPSNSLMVKLSGDGKQEVYDYPGDYTERGEGDRYARIRLEEREVAGLVVTGTSRCRAFSAGYRFTLEDYFRDDTNQEYVLTEVIHKATDTTYRSSRDGAHSYQNTFKAIPKTVQYRPPRKTRKPFVQGTQTALVVGTAGDEILVDKYGRVKVQFYWDRLGKKDQNSSCWVRVSQIWAGKNWGWITTPRIGQEVIVDFLEGDPDYPIITGRVYNAEQMPPYTLPANQTQSGIKTRSSKDGGADNFNEIRFEDLKGSEMLTVHAEKDMDTTVEHDDTQHVQNDRTIKVDGKHTETIIKDTTIKITEGNHSLTLNQGNQSITLDMGDQSTKITLGKAKTEAMQSIELIVGQSSIKLDQMGVTIKGMMIKIEAEIQTQVKGLLVDVNAEALLKMQGGITMIN